MRAPGWTTPDYRVTPEFIKCSECGAARRVAGTKVVGQADPTEIYLLTCGHVTL